ncbi:MAG: ABC transporter substrate-binding protein [Thermodesulfobacteriota bacterium]|nr:ABC transporter substrate-binding protein [Thermodesulfobacteriota bacterium]
MGTIKKSFFFMRYVLAISALSFTLLSANLCKSYGNDVPGVTDKSVKIGLMGDLTGPAADVWIPFANGIRAFFKMMNYGGGIHGRKIEYILEDDRYSIPLALSSFKKLVFKDKVFVLQAASGVGHSAAIIPLVEKEKIPLITPTGERKFFVPARKYVFSTIPWYEDQAKLAVEYVFNDMKLQSPVIALLYGDVGSGKDSRNTFRELVKIYPVKKYVEIAFPLAAMDFTSEMLAMRRSKPDIVYIHGHAAHATSILKAARRLGLSSTFIVAQYACVDKAVKISGKNASGLLGINCFGTWDDASTGVNRLRKASLAYNPNVSRRDANFFQGWFTGMLFYEGLQNAGRDLTRETYLKGLEAIKNFDTEGICGIVSFSPDDHKSIEYHRFYKADIEKKRFVPISGWRKPKDY